ncbi:uncharacterized protein FRV6_13869 [Fusarium oxysporum]|uniref:Uncharacterized protein n=1 Tax=Fusarium oxysporum TaxID=5507 RepID=A0A2H3TVI2_FUSOX|nr:uncharacterized protein FRV6_13869 [Fusarium oxysporum]
MVFFRAHNFFVWAMQAESEEQRYRSIENHLKARVDQSVVDQTFYQACHDLLTADEIPVASLTEEVRNTLMENFNEIDNTTWPKLMYTLRAHTENRLVDPRAFLSTPINNQLVQIARQVTAMIGNRLEHFRVIQFPFMCRGRWFLGYSPGTFIFRYSNSLPFTEGVNNTPGHMNFKFEGQVPRSSYEHKLRLESLWKPASELFISTIQLFVGRSHRARYPRQDFLRTRGMIGPDMFKPILEDWISCSQGSNFVFPGQDTKDSILRHVVTQELAWLLLQLKDVPGIYEGVHSQELENLLTAATGISLQDLADHWNTTLGSMAWGQFCSGNRGELFIYENQGQLDIWSLYNNQTFKYDCLNPSVEHNLPRLRDCRAALQPYDQLIQERLRQAHEEAEQSGQVSAQPFNAPFPTQN